jgi:hypothetical protein
VGTGEVIRITLVAELVPSSVPGSGGQQSLPPDSFRFEVDRIPTLARTPLTAGDSVAPPVSPVRSVESGRASSDDGRFAEDDSSVADETEHDLDWLFADFEEELLESLLTV